MGHSATPKSLLAVLQRITLEMISTLELEDVLSAVTQGLVEELGAEFARIWLLGPGDLCGSCYKVEHCKNRHSCLHLKSSAGLSENVNGTYRRVPLGAFKIGRIAEVREPTCTRDVQRDPRIQDHRWARRNGLQSFAGYPLTFRDEVLGVLGVFTAHILSDADFSYLEIFAREAAMAIKNAQLFAENETLTTRLKAENIYLKQELHEGQSFGEIIGEDPTLRKVLSEVERVAPTNAPVLIQGETGTGKELIARAVHRLSQRQEGPLIKVNCGAISAGLVESELFGHEKGAFTGASGRRLGRFELANGGSIFLDEVGDLPLDTQVKLLRVLQEGEFERVGSSVTHRTDVRVVAATNRQLGSDIDQGRFRSDLYYRLDVFPLQVPPLRERGNDVLLLAHHFLSRLSVDLKKKLDTFTGDSLRWMIQYDWPGNVRELRNVVERAAILARSSVVDIPRLAPRPADGTSADSTEDERGSSLMDFERRHILRMLEKTAWVIQGESGAARALGLAPSTLRSKIKKLGIARPRA